MIYNVLSGMWSNQPTNLVKLKNNKNSQPVTAVRSVKPIVPDFRRKSFNVRFVPICQKIPLAVFWQKIFYILTGFIKKNFFKLNMGNFSM